jgi:hypothetical protein
MNTHSSAQLTPGILTLEVTHLIEYLLQWEALGIVVDGLIA